MLDGQLTPRKIIILVASVVWCVGLPQAMAASTSPDAESDAILAKYAAAADERDIVSAVGHLLDYSVLVEGEFAPKTAQLTHRYGVLLMRSGDYREAVSVLKTALERSDVAFGEFAGEAFDINMNIGSAYAHLGRRWIYGIDYYDRALEILRQSGERETVRYVTTLLHIAASLADDEKLSGNTTSTVVNDPSTLEGNQTPLNLRNETRLNLQHDYRDSFNKAARYLDEAEVLAGQLVHVDRYLPAKVAIARTKLNFLHTVDRAKVTMGVRGRISKRSVAERNEYNEKQLAAAMAVLAEDAEANAAFLTVANGMLLDIAWLNNDRQRMEAMCASGDLNSAGDYPSDRLFRITADGSILAPDFGFRVPTNLFDDIIRRQKSPRNEQGNRIPIPYYVPVCVNGELMAALVNAPRVHIEEFR